MRVIDANGVHDPVNAKQDNQGDEQIVDLNAFHDRLPHLLDLREKAENANADLREAIKGVAEKSGLYAANIRAVVNAKFKQNEEAVERKATQLALVFEEVSVKESVSPEGAAAATKAATH